MYQNLLELSALKKRDRILLPQYFSVRAHLMPQGLVYSLPQNDMSSLEHFVKVQLVDGLVVSELKPVPVPYGKMVLVCTHMSRDKRCGRAGPQVTVYVLTPF